MTQRLLLVATGNQHKDSKLVNLQRTTDCEVARPKSDIHTLPQDSETFREEGMERLQEVEIVDDFRKSCFPDTTEKICI